MKSNIHIYYHSYILVLSKNCQNGILLHIFLICVSGYGHIAPSTSIGKLVTIFYTIIGIPLFLLYLSNIGDIMATSFKWTYSRVCKCQVSYSSKIQNGLIKQNSINIFSHQCLSNNNQFHTGSKEIQGKGHQRRGCRELGRNKRRFETNSNIPGC